MIKDTIKLIRPLNVAITILAVYAGCIIAGPEFISWKIIWAAISAGLIAAYGNMVNDIFDLALDRMAKLSRPLPAGTISVRMAWIVALWMAGVGLILAALINPMCLAIAFLICLLLYLYTPYLKGFGFWGNVVVALIGGLSFVYAAAAVGNMARGLIPGVFAFLFHLIREIIKDIEDMRSDREFGVRTGAVIYGGNISRMAAMAAALILIILTIGPFIYGQYGRLYLAIILIAIDIPVVYFMAMLMKSSDVITCGRISGYMKAIMPLGIIALFLGSRGF